MELASIIYYMRKYTHTHTQRYSLQVFSVLYGEATLARDSFARHCHPVYLAVEVGGNSKQIRLNTRYLFFLSMEHLTI